METQTVASPIPTDPSQYPPFGTLSWQDETDVVEDTRSEYERYFSEACKHRFKMYGREHEKEQIISVYHGVRDGHSVVNGSSRCSRSKMILIQGPTGVGKSCLARSIRHEVEVVDSGYMVYLKFCQMQPPEPHSVFVGAINHFAKQVIERGESRTFRQSILNDHLSFEDDLESLLAAMPALKSMFELVPGGDQDTLATEEPSHDVDSEDDASVQNGTNIAIKSKTLSTNTGVRTSRLKDAIRIIFQAIAALDKPVVVLMDDLHWADEWSLCLVNAILEDGASERMLFIGTSREESFVGTKRVNECLEKLRDSFCRITRMDLVELVEADIVCLLTDGLTVDADNATFVGSIAANWTKGNPFLIWEFLRTLYKQNGLRFDDTSGRYICDLGEGQFEKHTVESHYRAKIEELASADQEHIKKVACIGMAVNDKVLRCLLSCDNAAFASFTNHVADKDLLYYDSSRGLWCFTHNLIQELVYQMIPSGERASYHYQIGRKLWRMLTSVELNEYIFLVVEKLTISIEHLDSEKERTAIAKLCLCAGLRAVQLSSFNTSIRYLEDGIALLSSESWTDEYCVSLDLYSAAAEVANSLGNFDRVHQLFDVVQQHARVLADILRAHAAMVHTLGRTGQYADAVKLSRELLDKLGEHLPVNPWPIRTHFELMALRRRLKGKTNEAIVRLPNMVDDKKLAVMQILNLMFLYALMGRLDIVPHIGYRMVRLTLDYGLSAVSGVGFVLFAGSLCGLGNDVKEGYRIGRLSFMLYEKFDCKAWLARLTMLYYEYVHGWVKSLDDCQEELKRASQAGLETGDVEFALICEIIGFCYMFETNPLPNLVRFWDCITRRLKVYSQESAMLFTVAERQMIEILMGRGDGNPLALEGRFIDTATADKIKSIPMLDAWSQVFMSILLFLYGNYDEAATCAKRARVCAARKFGPHCVSMHVFICGLMDVVHAHHKQHRRASYAQRCSKQLKYAASQGDQLNFIGKHYLLEAELAALAGNVSSALSLFTDAITTSQKGQHFMLTAIANERAARFLLELDEPNRASPYFEEALAWYASWGATGKVEHLQEEIHRLNFQSGSISRL